MRLDPSPEGGLVAFVRFGVVAQFGTCERSSEHVNDGQALRSQADMSRGGQGSRADSLLGADRMLTMHI
jgi:hypothetical protein